MTEVGIAVCFTVFCAAMIAAAATWPRRNPNGRV